MALFGKKDLPEHFEPCLKKLEENLEETEITSKEDLFAYRLELEKYGGMIKDMAKTWKVTGHEEKFRQYEDKMKKAEEIFGGETESK